ncbi:DUF6082 family protein [Actinoplanes sp. N902-109]|uniref:DUF6082 family protein n=1 Tax=Actinoplanes sp. (strain N902-109) TaxID=649831 RepID=UPI0012FA9D0C|nr:DUF6082 family protein [Actinoplanes sp. N902-109]
MVATTLLAGVGLAAALGRQGGTNEWQRWSDVGQTFGVLSSIVSSLALLAVVITARQNKAEFERQRQFLIHNHVELRRTSHANLGMLHQQLIKMSMDDEELAKVWPAFDPGLSAATNRQYLYANLIYSFQLRALQSENHSDASIIESMRYLFSNPIMRNYWNAAEGARHQLDPQSTEFAFAQRVDKICAEYEKVVARYEREIPVPSLVPENPQAHAA